MKYLLVPILILHSILAYSQSENEKKCTVRSRIFVSHTNDEGNNLIDFHCSMFLSGFEPCEQGDTIEVEYNDQKELSVSWSYFDDFNGWYFNNCDSVQWFYNGTMLSNESYLVNDTVVNGSCGLALKASSSIDSVQLGYYELRAVGNNNSLIKTKFPIIHFYEKQNSIEEEQGVNNEIVNIYPNPIINSVTVTLQEPLSNGKLVVHDLNGRVITKSEIDNTLEKDFDFSQLNQGIYVFSIVDESNGEVIFRNKMKK